MRPQLIALIISLCFFNIALAEDLQYAGAPLEGVKSLSSLQQERAVGSATYAVGTLRLTKIKPFPVDGVKLTCSAPKTLPVEYVVEESSERFATIFTAQGSFSAKTKRKNGLIKAVKAKLNLGGGDKQVLKFSKFKDNQLSLAMSLTNVVGKFNGQAVRCQYRYKGNLATRPLQ